MESMLVSVEPRRLPTHSFPHLELSESSTSRDMCFVLRSLDINTNNVTY